MSHVGFLARGIKFDRSCGVSEATFVLPCKPLIAEPLITTNVPLLIKPQTQPSLSLITLSSPFPPLAAPRQPSAGRGQPARSRASLDVAGAARGEPGNVGAWPILAGFPGFLPRQFPAEHPFATAAAPPCPSLSGLSHSLRALLTPA